MYRRIMVPLDDTPASHYALPWALAIARKAGSPIDLVRVIPAAFSVEPFIPATLDRASAEQARGTARETLGGLAERVTAAGVETRAVVLDGDVLETLREHLESSGADLIVMTTHDGGRVERFFMGSLAESLVRRVHCPVLLVRAGNDDVPPFDDVRTAATVLVALDGSPFADAMLPHAITFATCFQSEIVLASVIQPVAAVAAITADAPEPNVIDTLPPAREGDPAPGEVTTYSDVLERAARGIGEAGLAARTVVLAGMHPAHAIVEYANRENADVIAMTTHGRGALKRLVAGSASRGVLLATRKPLLVYRPEGV